MLRTLLEQGDEGETAKLEALAKELDEIMTREAILAARLEELEGPEAVTEIDAMVARSTQEASDPPSELEAQSAALSKVLDVVEKLEGRQQRLSVDPGHNPAFKEQLKAELQAGQRMCVTLFSKLAVLREEVGGA